MPYPPFASIDNNYTAFQAGQGDNSFPGMQVDEDLANLKIAIDALNTWLRAVTRADGEVGNQTIGAEQLKPELVLGIKPPVAWTPSTPFGAGDTVFFGVGYYIATVDHTSSESFPNDLSAGKWLILIDFSVFFDDASALQKGANLSDLLDAAASRANLGLPSAFLGYSGGNFTAGTAKITGLGDPTVAQDAATLAWTKARIGVIDVTDYAAVGDGTTDNTAALTAASAAAVTAGKPLFFPAGTYANASNLTIAASLRAAAGASLKPASGVRVALQGFGEKEFGGGPLMDLSAGGTVQFSRQWARTLRISDFLTSPDAASNQSEAFRKAFIALYANNGYSSLDLEGRLINLGTDISLVFGENGLAADINSQYQRNKLIHNGKLRWGGGTASADQASEFMISIEAPDVNSSYLMLGLNWSNVTFDANGSAKNLLRLAGYYEFKMDSCTFNDYGAACAVFLDDVDNDGEYVSGNGAHFVNCRWRGLEFTSPVSPLGCPLRSYPGDTIVEGGNCDTTGSMDFHSGPVTVQNIHFSYASSLTDGMTPGVTIRDPREIVICNCDMDNAGILITNQGHAAELAQNATVNWRCIHIAGNKIALNDDPASGYGWCTFTTDQVDTIVNGLSIGPNPIFSFTGSGANGVSEVRFRTPSGGTIKYADCSGIYVSSGSYGAKPDGGQWGPAGTTAFPFTFISEAEVRTTRFAFSGDAAVGGGLLSDGGGGTYVLGNGTSKLRVISNGNISADSDNARTNGTPSIRWSTVYAGTGTINTSDEREKTEIGAVPDEWLDAWGEVEWVRFKFIDAVEAKGDEARWHVGLVAQRVDEVFKRHGLDATKVGLLCYDEWPAEPGLLDKDGNVVREAREAGNRWGVRYDEAEALESAWTRRAVKQLGAKRPATKRRAKRNV